MTKTAWDLLPGFHPHYSLLAAGVRVFRVPRVVCAITHDCPALRKPVTISIIRATHNSLAGGVCGRCNIAFIEEDPSE